MKEIVWLEGLSILKGDDFEAMIVDLQSKFWLIGKIHTKKDPDPNANRVAECFGLCRFLINCTS